MSKNFVATTLVSIDGTGLRGYVSTTYDKLVEAFGKPQYTSGGDKTTCEWNLVFTDGTIATIYDYKEYETPLHEYEWHVGGFTNKAVDLVKAELGL